MNGDPGYLYRFTSTHAALSICSSPGELLLHLREPVWTHISVGVFQLPLVAYTESQLPSDDQLIGFRN